MKAPTHATPSGDRTIAQLFLKMLRNAGDDIQLVSSLRTYLNSPEDLDHKQLSACRESQRLVRAFRAPNASWSPEIWLTYHNYYKAPDLVGPVVARELNIPYVIAEPSLAPHRETTDWAAAQKTVLAALSQADHLWAFNKKDLSVLLRRPDLKQKTTLFAPFVETPPCDFRRKSAVDARHVPKRARNLIQLVTVAVARPGKKQLGYRQLCTIVDRLPRQGWHLSIIGDVPAASVSTAIMRLRHHPCVTVLGQMERDALWHLYARSDFFIWPGLQEAVGLAALEAQSSGLPVIAYHTPGTDMTIRHGCTGLLATKGNRQGFAEFVRMLITSQDRRSAMGLQAKRRAKDHFNLDTKGRHLSRAMAGIVAADSKC